MERVTEITRLVEVCQSTSWDGLHFFRVGNGDDIPPLEIICDDRGALTKTTYTITNRLVGQAPLALTKILRLPGKAGRPLVDQNKWPPGAKDFDFLDDFTGVTPYLVDQSLLVCLDKSTAPPVEWLYAAPSLHVAFDAAGTITHVLFPDLSEEGVATLLLTQEELIVRG